MPGLVDLRHGPSPDDMMPTTRSNLGLPVATGPPGASRCNRGPPESPRHRGWNREPDAHSSAVHPCRRHSGQCQHRELFPPLAHHPTVCCILCARQQSDSLPAEACRHSVCHSSRPIPVHRAVFPVSGDCSRHSALAESLQLLCPVSAERCRFPS